MITEDRPFFSPDGLKQSTNIKFRRTVSLGTAGTTVIALLGLFGYFTGQWVLGSIRMNYIPMAPSSAFCFLVFSAVLFLHVRKPWQGFGLTAMATLVLITIVFDLLAFAELFAGMDLNFDEKLFPLKGTIGGIPIGRMSSASGFVFTVTGLGIFLLLLRGRSSRHVQRLGHWTSSLGALTSLAGATVILDYLYGTPLMYGGSTVPMAATTAIAFLFLGIALVASAGPESFPMCHITGNSTSAMLTRVFLPLTVIALLLQNALSRSIAVLPLFNEALLLAVMAVTLGTITAFVVARVARSIGNALDEVNNKLAASEHALEANAIYLRTILETEPDCVKLLDSECNLLMMNQSGLKMIEADSFEQVRGQCICPLICEEHRESFIAMTKRGFLGIPGTLEFEVIGLKGRHLWLATHAVPFRNEQGEIVSLLGITRNITERKLADAALFESEAHYRSLFESSLIGVVVANRDFIIIEANDAFCKLLGYEKEELINKFSIAEVSHPDDAAISIDMVKQLMSNEIDHYTLEKRYISKTGNAIDVLVFVRGLYSLNREFGGAVATVLDLSEQRRAEAERLSLERQLQHAQKLESLGVLAGGIAHDFNNILTSIVGNADLALMRINPESPVINNLHQIEHAAARAADLAKQMLAYSGKGKFIVENLDLNRLLEEMLHMLEVSISKKAVLRMNLTPNLPPVEADATQIRQIIMNLVINASEAIGDKSGVIAISTGCMDCDKSYLKNVWLDENISEGLYVYLEISDTGCGMGKETLAKIFDPFFTTKFTGRGLGMAAVLGIVRGHKGAIRVYSEPKKGTSFKILLPASGKPTKIFNVESFKNDWKGTGKVLLVDDEETVRGIGKEMLQDLGFSTITANDGREAIEMFKQNSDIAFVILDLTMPHMDGEQCFRELRQLNPDVKVIMSSGYNEQDVTQKFVGKGLAGFIQKPYKLSVLKDAIHKI